MPCLRESGAAGLQTLRPLGVRKIRVCTACAACLSSDFGHRALAFFEEESISAGDVTQAFGYDLPTLKHDIFHSKTIEILLEQSSEGVRYGSAVSHIGQRIVEMSGFF